VFSTVNISNKLSNLNTEPVIIAGVAFNSNVGYITGKRIFSKKIETT